MVDGALPVGGSGQAGTVKQPPRWRSCEMGQDRGDKETVRVEGGPWSLLAALFPLVLEAKQILRSSPRKLA